MVYSIQSELTTFFFEHYIVLFFPHNHYKNCMRSFGFSFFFFGDGNIQEKNESKYFVTWFLYIKLLLRTAVKGHKHLHCSTRENNIEPFLKTI